MPAMPSENEVKYDRQLYTVTAMGEYARLEADLLVKM